MKNKKKNKELIFVPSKDNWFIPHNHGTETSDIKGVRDNYQKIIKRDNYTCYFCGFRSKRYQEIHHINHRHNDCSENNLTTVCPLCHQYFHLSTCGMNDSALMIFLPEFSQEELNNLCIYIFSMLNGKNVDEQWKTLAVNLYGKLRDKSNELTQYFHSQSIKNPTSFEIILLSLNKETSLSRIKDYSKLIKLLPTETRFARQARYWSKKELVELNKWIDLIPEDVNIEEIYSKFNE